MKLIDTAAMCLVVIGLMTGAAACSQDTSKPGKKSAVSKDVDKQNDNFDAVNDDDEDKKDDDDVEEIDDEEADDDDEDDEEDDDEDKPQDMQGLLGIFGPLLKTVGGVGGLDPTQLQDLTKLLPGGANLDPTQLQGLLANLPGGGANLDATQLTSILEALKPKTP